MLSAWTKLVLVFVWLWGFTFFNLIWVFFLIDALDGLVSSIFFFQLKYFQSFPLKIIFFMVLENAEINMLGLFDADTALNRLLASWKVPI